MRKIATMTSKGQITVPLALRESLSLNTGDKVVFERKGNQIILSPLRQEDAFEQLRGLGTPGIGRGKKAVLRWVRDVRGNV